MLWMSKPAKQHEDSNDQSNYRESLHNHSLFIYTQAITASILAPNA